MRVVRSKLAQLVQLLRYGAAHPGLVKAAAGSLYHDLARAEGSILHVPFKEILPESWEGSISLRDFVPRDGNLALADLMFLCSCVSAFTPEVILEIGTFDGNTTLQMAANASTSAKIYTLDLPDDTRGDTVTGIDPYDAKYIDRNPSFKRRFVNSQFASQIVQRFGNSLELDFESLLDGEKADLVFIDAGHSYECVKNDTEKALRVLRAGGLIIWDDYTVHWPGVYTYLNDLSRRLPLRAVTGTRLVTYRNDR